MAAEPGLWQNRNWRWLFAGQTVSLVGDAVFDITVVLWVGTVIAHGYSWAPAAVGGVLIAAAAPVLVIGPLAGVYVDRLDRRRIMMVTDLVRAALVGGLVLFAVAGTRLPVAGELSAVYAIVALASAASQFFNPARFAVIRNVVAGEDRTRAFSVSQASVSAASVLGPPLAAPLLFSAGVHWALLCDAASFLVSLASVRAIRLPEAGRPAVAFERRSFGTELLEGLRFFGRSRTLTVLTAAIFVYTFGVGAINVLDVFFVSDNLGVMPEWLGTLTAGFGVGSIVGALVVGPVAPRLGETRVFCLGLSLAGLVILVYSRMTLLPAGMAALSLGGVPVGAVSAVAGPLVLRATPEQLLGRVTAVLNPLMQLASILSMALGGFLASTVLLHLDTSLAGVHLGRIDAIFGASALLMVASGLAALRPLSRAGAESAPGRSMVGS